jgi:hypothetical protein
LRLAVLSLLDASSARVDRQMRSAFEPCGLTDPDSPTPRLVVPMPEHQATRQAVACHARILSPKRPMVDGSRTSGWRCRAHGSRTVGWGTMPICADAFAAGAPPNFANADVGQTDRNWLTFKQPVSEGRLVVASYSSSERVGRSLP